MNTNEQMNNAIPTDLPGGIDGAGVYHTPKAAIDAVLANPPFGGCKLPPGADGVEVESQPTPISPDVPEMAEEDRHMSYPEAVASIPEIGIEFKSVHTKTYHKYFCYWHNAEKSDEHVYEVTVQAFAPDSWQSIALNDGKEIFALYSNGKRNALELALAAMRRYLLRGHRSAWRTWRKAKKAAKMAAEPAKAAEPLTPEEELADTIARQKEEA